MLDPIRGPLAVEEIVAFGALEFEAGSLLLTQSMQGLNTCERKPEAEETSCRTEVAMELSPLVTSEFGTSLYMGDLLM